MLHIDMRQLPEAQCTLTLLLWTVVLNRHNFLYGQDMNELIDWKISTEEAERAIRQAQRVAIEEEEDLSKEEESSEEEGHHKEDIEEDKTKGPCNKKKKK